MHVSVNWAQDYEGIIYEVRRVLRDPPPLKHVILYPSLRPKELQTEPFRTAYDYLNECLLGAEVLVVIGTSLRDTQLTVVIRSAFRANSRIGLIAIGPSVDFERVAETVGVEPRRVAALRGNFGEHTERLFLLASEIRRQRGKLILGRNHKPGATRKSKRSTP